MIDRTAAHPPAIDRARLSRRGLLRACTAAAGLSGLTSLVGCGAPTAPVPAATVAPFPGNADPPLLVDAAWLREAHAAETGESLPRPQGEDRPLILDLSPLRTYRAGHVPGAVHAWWQDTMDPHDPVYGVVLKNRRDPFNHATVLADLGIDAETHVVAYDADRNRYAARIAWYLRYVGHRRATVLDGGLAAWRGAGGEVDRDGHSPPSAAPTDPIGRRSFVIATEELAERIDDPDLAILDIRTDEEADDDLNGTLPIGQIPGAVRVPWTATLRDDAGRLRSPDDLTVLFAAAGVTPDREVAVVARFGVESGQPWLVLTLLGFPTVRVYDQGWAAWAARSTLPIAPVAPPAVPIALRQ